MSSFLSSNWRIGSTQSADYQKFGSKIWEIFKLSGVPQDRERERRLYNQFWSYLYSVYQYSISLFFQYYVHIIQNLPPHIHLEILDFRTSRFAISGRWFNQNLRWCLPIPENKMVQNWLIVNQIRFCRIWSWDHLLPKLETYDGKMFYFGLADDLQME